MDRRARIAGRTAFGGASRAVRRALAIALLALLPSAGPARTFGLPASSEYKGEIRRDPEGRLSVVESGRTLAGTAGASRPATLKVGPGERVRTIGEAAEIARDGDVVEILPGDYRGQPAVWTQNELTIRGGGERPVLFADGRNVEGKALWIVRGGAIHIENLEFRGARVPDGNGAGIRFERGRLSIHRCAFVDNEMGLLTGNSPELSLEISDSEFSDAPRHDGALHHLLYVGAIDRFVLTGSRFSNGYRGHLVKSRARENHVRYNLLADGPEGRASYELEFPNGGLAHVVGNVIAQSAATDNPILVAYGAEGRRWPDNALYFAHDTLIDARRQGGTLLKLWADEFPDGMEVWILNNLIVGAGESGLHPPPRGRFEGNRSAPESALIEFAGLPVRLKPDDPLRGSVRVPGAARGEALWPDAEFTLPAGQRPIRPGRALAPGAFQ
ncbi:MAG: hypothetical protein LBD06_09755 [Candidatus Accumulibacter sp.]|nr:hypothetical protein [Accumulibacter sp.]